MWYDYLRELYLRCPPAIRRKRGNNYCKWIACTFVTISGGEERDTVHTCALLTGCAVAADKMVIFQKTLWRALCGHEISKQGWFNLDCWYILCIICTDHSISSMNASCGQLFISIVWSYVCMCRHCWVSKQSSAQDNYSLDRIRKGRKNWTVVILLWGEAALQF